MLPAKSTLIAASRWLTLAEKSSFEVAAAILRSDSKYSDLSLTQYAMALDWLYACSLTVQIQDRVELSPQLIGITSSARAQILLTEALLEGSPAWLRDADLLVLDDVDLPQDVLLLSEALGLTGETAVQSVRRAFGKVDLAARSAFGAIGEAALVQLLENRYPGAVHHVSILDDGLGYDVVLSVKNRVFHLEIKSTARQGRLIVYISRNEYEVSRVDPNWYLVIVGVGWDNQIRALSFVNAEELPRIAPRDVTAGGRWESARLGLDRKALSPFCPWEPESTGADIFGFDSATTWAWMPSVL